MRIVFIRHSKTTQLPHVPITEWGLSDEGIRRAVELSGDEEIQRIDVIYTSLQTKALETGLILAKPNAIPIKTNDSFTEVTSLTRCYEPDFGIYESNLRRLHSGEIGTLHGGESFGDARERFMKALAHTIDLEREKEMIGIVSHGNMLSIVLAPLMGEQSYDLQKTMRMPDYFIMDWVTKTVVKRLRLE